MTVKRLEAEIKNLRKSNDDKKSQIQSLSDQLSGANDNLEGYRCTVSRLNTQNTKLQEQIEELKSRPIEAVVTEPTENERRLKETIRNLELTTEQQLEDLQNQQLRDVRELHRKHDEELKTALAEQKYDYEEQIGELKRQIKEGGSDTKIVRSLFDNIRKDTMNRFQSLALYAYNHTRDIAALRDEVYKLTEEEQEFLNSLYGGRE
jgi:chromosome segregation ATPase